MVGHNTTAGAHAIILAAGANTRLNEVVPPFFKPLLLVNGKPLIRQAVDHARECWGVNDVTIVASPKNVEQILEVEKSATHVVIQPKPTGVVDAVRRGLITVTAPWTLILCADNTFSEIDARRIRSAVFGARKLERSQAMRFTRYIQRASGVHLLEANDSRQEGDGCWIGPLMLDTRSLLSVIPHVTNVSDMIVNSTDQGKNIEPIFMECSDLGIPEAL